MNPVTLEKLLIAQVDSVRQTEATLKKLDVFCDKNWGLTFHDALDVDGMQGDHIVEWLDYGNANVNLNEFIKFMDEAKKRNTED